MGKRGTKPQPRILKLEKGTLQPCRDKPELELETIKEVPTAPDRLNQYGKDAWHFLIPKLMENRVISETDLFQFENMCYNYGEWRKCCDEVEKNGYTYISDKGNEMPNPMVHIASAFFKGYNQIAAKFGLTPSDRVGLPDTLKKQTDPLEELIKNASGA